MMMSDSSPINDLIEKLVKVERSLAKEKGQNNLFALFLRGDNQKWDLVISARWFHGKDKKAVLDLIIKNLKTELNEVDFELLSKVVILNPDEPFVRAINSAVGVSGVTHVVATRFDNIFINHAVIFTSKHI